MFKSLFKRPIRFPIQNNLWRSPKRMREAARLNAKPFIEYSVVYPLTPPKPKAPM